MQLTCPRSEPGIQTGVWNPWIQTLNRWAVSAQEPWAAPGGGTPLRNTLSLVRNIKQRSSRWGHRGVGKRTVFQSWFCYLLDLLLLFSIRILF